jgi:hypothetical protein
MAQWNQKAEEAKAANPGSYGVGAVGGTVAPALIPGVGQLGIAGNAALGSAYALGNTDLTQNPSETVKTGLLGAGMGAAGGALAQKLTPEVKTLAKYAEQQNVANAGISKNVLKGTDEEFQSLGKFIGDKGLVGTDKPELLNKARLVQEDIGSKIGEIGTQAKDLGIVVKPEVKQNAVNDLLTKSGEYANLTNVEAKKLARTYKGAAVDLQTVQGDWGSIEKLKRQYGRLAFNDAHEVKPGAEAAKDTYFHLKDMLKNISQDAQLNPNVSAEYKQALQQYHQIGDVVDGLEGMAAQERAGGQPHGGGAHGFARIIKSLPGQGNPAINLPTAAAVSTFLHPAAGMAVALPTLTNPAVRSMAATGIAKALPAVQGTAKLGSINIMSRLMSNPQSFGKYSKPLLKAAQTGGSDEVAATHYIMSLQHPDYNAMTQEQSDEQL